MSFEPGKISIQDDFDVQHQFGYHHTFKSIIWNHPSQKIYLIENYNIEFTASSSPLMSLYLIPDINKKLYSTQIKSKIENWIKSSQHVSKRVPCLIIFMSSSKSPTWHLLKKDFNQLIQFSTLDNLKPYIIESLNHHLDHSNNHIQNLSPIENYFTIFEYKLNLIALYQHISWYQMSLDIYSELEQLFLTHRPLKTLYLIPEPALYEKHDPTRSVFDFNCYIFNRQLELYLAMNLKDKAITLALKHILKCYKSLKDYDADFIENWTYEACLNTLKFTRGDENPSLCGTVGQLIYLARKMLDRTQGTESTFLTLSTSALIQFRLANYQRFSSLLVLDISRFDAAQHNFQSLSQQFDRIQHLYHSGWKELAKSELKSVQLAQLQVSDYPGYIKSLFLPSNSTIDVNSVLTSPLSLSWPLTKPKIKLPKIIQYNLGQTLNLELKLPLDLHVDELKLLWAQQCDVSETEILTLNEIMTEVNLKESHEFGNQILTEYHIKSSPKYVAKSRTLEMVKSNVTFMDGAHILDTMLTQSGFYKCQTLVMRIGLLTLTCDMLSENITFKVKPVVRPMKITVTTPSFPPVMDINIETREETISNLTLDFLNSRFQIESVSSGQFENLRLIDATTVYFDNITLARESEFKFRLWLVSPVPASGTLNIKYNQDCHQELEVNCNFLAPLNLISSPLCQSRSRLFGQYMLTSNLAYSIHITSYDLILPPGLNLVQDFNRDLLVNTKLEPNGVIGLGFEFESESFGRHAFKLDVNFVILDEHFVGNYRWSLNEYVEKIKCDTKLELYLAESQIFMSEFLSLSIKLAFGELTDTAEFEIQSDDFSICGFERLLCSGSQMTLNYKLIPLRCGKLSWPVLKLIMSEFGRSHIRLKQ